MLKLITAGDYSDYTIIAVLDIPDNFDYNKEFVTYRNKYDRDYNEGEQDKIHSEECKRLRVDEYEGVDGCIVTMFVAHLVKDLRFEERQIDEIHYSEPELTMRQIPYKKVGE